MRLRKKILTSLLYLLGLTIIFLIVWHVGISEVVSLLLSTDPYMFLLAVLVYFLGCFVLTLRWNTILSISNYRASLKNLFLLIMMGQFINNITPSMRGGSEPFRAYYLSKLEGIPKSISFSSVIVERVLDTIAFLILSFFVILYLLIKGIPIVEELVVIWLLIGALMVTGVYLIMHRSLPYRVASKLIKLISTISSRSIPEREVHKSIEDLQQNILFLHHNRRKMVLPFVLTFLWWFLDILKNYILFLSIGYYISPVVLSLTYLVSLLVGLLPTLPGSLGVSDALSITLYSYFGIPHSISTTGTLLDRVVSYIIPTVLGFLAYYLIRRELKGVKK
ncbi:flippase-like domain-containing protein [Methanothermococcus sp. SCGC AD-155-E23]|nr:flippase-like domain-containing protein [Methanothermococcus sp. SCGC AD-155-E23]